MKPKALLIAEKPSVARDVKAIYESNMSKFDYDIDFTNARGHLVVLSDPDKYTPEWGSPWNLEVLPMIPEHWKTEVKVPDQFQIIQSMVTNNHYDYIINACDAAREGCLIFYRIYNMLDIDIPVLRFWSEDLSIPSVTHALQNLRPAEEFMGLRHAAYLRSYLDWLVGMNLSRAGSVSTKTRLIVGRVESPTLNMIVSREREIEQFVPEDYYEVEASFITDKGETYHGLLYEGGAAKHFSKQEEADTVCRTVIAAKNALVTDIRQETETIYAPELHNLTELQKEAAKIFGYSPDQTLSIAQSLYEKHKILSYPRTDCRYLTKNLTVEIPERLSALAGIPAVKDYITAILGNKTRMEAVYNNKKYVNDAKMTDHHALIPTTTRVNLSKLTQEEQNVFFLVVRRFVGIFLDPNINSKSMIVTSSGDYTFQSNGKVLKQMGWRELYPSPRKDQELPDVSIGEVVTVGGELNGMPHTATVLSKQTQPPKRYNEATILEAMETCGKLLDDDELQKVLKDCKGLGTSATRASILMKLEKNEWIRKGNGKGKARVLIPTEKGKALIKTLEGTSVISPELTAVWEKRLRELEQNAGLRDTLYADMIKYIQDTTKEFATTLKAVEYDKISDKKSVGKCPDCGASVYIGKTSYYCANIMKKTIINGITVTECTFGFNKTISGASITEADASDLLTKGRTKEKTFTWSSGKKSKTYLILGPKKIKQIQPDGTVSYVDAPGHSVSFPDWNAPLCQCPYCGKNIIAGKNYYLCEGYKKGCTGGTSGVIIPREFFNTNISKEDVITILTEKRTITKKLTWKNGEYSIKPVFWNFDTGRIEYQKYTKPV